MTRPVRASVPGTAPELLGLLLLVGVVLLAAVQGASAQPGEPEDERVILPASWLLAPPGQAGASAPSGAAAARQGRWCRAAGAPLRGAPHPAAICFPTSFFERFSYRTTGPPQPRG
jgi:hypothetical protein